MASRTSVRTPSASTSTRRRTLLSAPVGRRGKGVDGSERSNLARLRVAFRGVMEAGDREVREALKRVERMYQNAPS